MRWLFRTKAEERHAQAKRAAKKLDREIERECRHYLNLVPKVLANCGIDHWVPRSDRPSLIEEKILGNSARMKVKLLEARYNAFAIYLWIDSRELPYRSLLAHLHTDEVLETLSDACDRQVVWRNVPGHGSWYIIWRNGAINAIPEKFFYQDAVAMIPQNAGPLYFIVGVAENNTLIKADLTKMPHYLVAGSTGQGKSVHLNSLLCQLITRNNPDRVQFLMIDLKGGSEFTFYEHLPHLWRPIITRPENVLAGLQEFYDEMERRSILFTQSGVKNIEGYNDKFRDAPLPYLVLVFDEVALMLKDLDRKMALAAESVLGNILARSRSSGGHCILCTQTPRSDVVTPYIKINCPTRICFAVPGNHDSMVVIDVGMAAGLSPQGRAIYSEGPHLTEMQSPYISDDMISKIVRESIERSGAIAPRDNHIVTIEHILEESISNWQGKLHTDKLYKVFAGRIGREKLDEMLNSLIGRELTFNGLRYKAVKKGTGRHGGRFLVPLDAPAGAAPVVNEPGFRLVLPHRSPKPTPGLLKPASEPPIRKAS
jgi:hypothetical protein